MKLGHFWRNQMGRRFGSCTSNQTAGRTRPLTAPAASRWGSKAAISTAAWVTLDIISQQQRQIPAAPHPTERGGDVAQTIPNMPGACVTHTQYHACMHTNE